MRLTRYKNTHLGIGGGRMNLNLSGMNFLFLWVLKINGLGFVK